MARQALAAEVRDGIGGLIVRVVTRATPHLRAAGQLALAHRQLLGVANDLQASLGAFRRDVVVNSEGLFQPLSRLEVGETFTRIRNPRDTHQMTLLAYAVPCC